MVREGGGTDETPGRDRTGRGYEWHGKRGWVISTPASTDGEERRGVDVQYRLQAWGWRRGLPRPGLLAGGTCTSIPSMAIATYGWLAGGE